MRSARLSPRWRRPSSTALVVAAFCASLLFVTYETWSVLQPPRPWTGILRGTNVPLTARDGGPALEAPYRVGNRMFRAASASDWAAASDACSDPLTAGDIRRTIGRLVARWGKLEGYGSTTSGSAVNSEPEISDEFSLKFAARNDSVEVRVRFRRVAGSGWRVASLTPVSE